MLLKLKIWRQKRGQKKGSFENYEMDHLSPDMSFLEMLDQLNEDLVGQKKVPVAFDHDCREGICGSCSLVINGNPHGPHAGSAVCQLHLRSFKDKEEIWIEPFRAKAFPVLQDLIVDRSAFDRIIQSGAYVSVNTGQAPEAHSILVEKAKAEEAFSHAACIGCGACVAVCKNASASLFVAAKVSHLALLPQGKVEKKARVLKMVKQMEKEGFGACTNTGACSRACPKEISLHSIARMNREYFKSIF
ncbi:MAG: succinate dehydrogenase/fumarate reductase iron-sulfur subunit [Bdellovibrionales bacterium]|nr:succinate dehydrogenase/fumarate reductase iron-sulfur subunit [Bdellovibrionales bacterium]